MQSERACCGFTAKLMTEGFRSLPAATRFDPDSVQRRCNRRARHALLNKRLNELTPVVGEFIGGPLHASAARHIAMLGRVGRQRVPATIVVELHAAVGSRMHDPRGCLE